jgi:hypothetical protein
MDAAQLRNALAHIRQVIERTPNAKSDVGAHCPLCLLEELGHKRDRDFRVEGLAMGAPGAVGFGIFNFHALNKAAGLAMVDASLAALGEA